MRGRPRPRVEQPGGCGTPPGRLSLVLAKESPPDPERKAALGGLICRGMVLSSRFDIYMLVSLRLYETGVRSFSRDGALRRRAYRGRFVERPRSTGISWGAFFGLGQRKRPRPRKESRLGGLICRGIVLSARFDIDTLVSLRLYETGVLSFPRDGALRRSAYVGQSLEGQTCCTLVWHKS